MSISVISLRPRLRGVARAVAAGLLLHAGCASAISLTQAYEAALQHDSTYRSAMADRDAGAEYRLLGRSALLPTISASYSREKNWTDLTQPDFLGEMTTTHPEYNSKVAEIQLRQPIYSKEAFARYKQGIAQTNYSIAQFDSRTQEMVLRVVGAYIDALFAEEQVRLAKAQRDTYFEQKHVNDRLFEKGEGTKTDMLETQSRLDLADAQLLEAQDNATTLRATLAALVGTDVDSVDELAPGFSVVPVSSGGYDALKASALTTNPDIQAAIYTVDAAEQEINKNRAGHTPRVDFIASFSRSNSESITTYNQDTTVRAVGVQVTIPIYSGGSVSAATRQAVANREKAKYDLQTQTDKVLVELRKQYSAMTSSVSRIHALDKAVASAELLMEATRQSIKGGVRINLDLLNAEQQLFTSRRDLAQARYNYLLSSLKVRAAAGTLSPADVHDLARYFN